MRARLCVSLATGAASAAREPDNAEYLLATQVWVRVVNTMWSDERDQPGVFWFAVWGE